MCFDSQDYSPLYWPLHLSAEWPLCCFGTKQTFLKALKLSAEYAAKDSFHLCLGGISPCSGLELIRSLDFTGLQMCAFYLATHF